MMWESIQNKIARKIIILHLGGWKARGIFWAYFSNKTNKRGIVFIGCKQSIGLRPLFWGRVENSKNGLEKNLMPVENPGARVADAPNIASSQKHTSIIRVLTQCQKDNVLSYVRQ